MENQSFKTMDVLYVFSVMVAVGALVFSLFTQSQAQKPEDQVRRIAENISSQLIALNPSRQQETNTTNLGTSRNPASVGGRSAHKLGPEGLIGEDPWGRPFRYKFVESATAGWSHLIVWSGGPDARLEMPIADWGPESPELKRIKSSQYISVGDDVALIQPIQNSP